MKSALVLIAVLGLLWLGAALWAGEEPVRVLTEFDAGSTLLLPPHRTFQIQLERKAGEAKEWIWPRIDETIVRVAAPKTETRAPGRPETIVETHSFTTVGPGTYLLYAELVDPRDHTRVHARYPVTLQVTE